jgi:hypothetical protein
MKVSELIEKKCWEIRQLLNEEECTKIREVGLKGGIENKIGAGDIRHRNNCRVLVEDSELSSTLWERIKTIVPQEIDISDPTSPPAGMKEDTARDMQGVWKPCGVNNTFTLLYYHNGGHFGPHRDSCVIKSDQERSIMTLATYLNDRPANHGGGTNFLKDEMDCPAVDSDGRIRSPDEFIEVRVTSDEGGKAVLFMHDLMHEGGTLEVRNEDGEVESEKEAKPKWLLISQVLYQRDPSTAPRLTSKQKEARILLKEAEEAEMNGDISLAIKKYNKAYKLDPSLES